MSCYDPLCKSATNYFNDNHNFPQRSHCAWYWYRQKIEDIKTRGEDWGECLLKLATYGYGYRIPIQTMLDSNHALVVGNALCQKQKSEYSENDITEGIHKEILLSHFIHLIRQLIFFV